MTLAVAAHIKEAMDKTLDKSSKPLDNSCQHHWMIDKFNQGVCSICGNKRDFQKEQDKYRKRLVESGASARGGMSRRSKGGY